MSRSRGFAFFSLILLLFLSIVARFYFHETGRMSPDSFTYIAYAKDFSQVKTAVFPLAYPWLIKGVSGVSGMGEMASSKLLGLLFVLASLLVAHFRYQKIAALLFFYCLSAMVTIFSTTWSEAVFIPVLCICLLEIRKSLTGSGKFGYLFIAGLLFLLFSLRYVALFIWISLLISLFVFFKNKAFRKSMAKSLFLSGCAIAVYLAFNWYSFGELFGELHRNNSSSLTLIEVSVQYLKALVLEFNYILPLSVDVNIWTSVLSFLMGLMGLGFYVFQVKKILFRFDFVKISLILGLVVSIGLVYSASTTKLDELSFRLMSPITTVLLFPFFIETHKKWLKTKYTLAVLSLCLVLGTTYVKKTASVFCFLNQKEKVEIDSNLQPE